MCNDQICQLVKNKDIWNYSPLQGLDLAKYSYVVELANAQLQSGECDLCVTQDAEILALKEFKIYYSNLVYYTWLLIRADGRVDPEGFISKASDDFSEFRVISASQAKAKAEAFKSGMLEVLKDNFLEKLKKMGLCQSKQPDLKCGCNNNCRCGKQETDYLPFEAI